MHRRTSPIYGHVITPPRVTRSGLYLALTRLALPFILALVALDVMVWAIMRFVFERCYGVWCWL